MTISSYFCDSCISSSDFIKSINISRTLSSNTIYPFIWRILILLFVGISGLDAQNIYVVNTNDDLDDGFCSNLHCSLREAINMANMTTGTVSFNIPGAGPQFISPATGLPKIINNDIIIDGATQPNGNIVIQGFNLQNGLYLQGNNIEVYGLTISNFNNAAILIDTTIQQDNVIIGSVTKPNVLTSNKYGILASTDQLSNVNIRSNYIGTDASLNNNLGNAYGILFSGTMLSAINIGGSINSSEGNYIMDSYEDGLTITNNTNVFGNYIGSNFNGTINLPNRISGIRILGSNNKIGNASPEFKNVIASNFEYAVDIGDNLAIENTISQNSMFCNGLGDILNNGNIGLSPPTIISTTNGVITGGAEPNSLVEIYKNDLPCTSCQSEDYLGSTTADVNGSWTFSLSSTITISLLASATDVNGNTSAFSTCYSPDECIGAYIIEVETNTCPPSFTLFNTLNATGSQDILYDCGAFVGGDPPTDIWLKAEVPTSGALMLKMNEGFTDINPMVEVYTGNCSSLTFEKCDSLFPIPYQFPVAELTPGSTVYFRVFDQYDITLGKVALNLIELPSDTALWEICTNGIINRAATEFIMQYDLDASPAEIQAIENELIADGMTLIDECNCSYRPLQLWRTGTPVELEDGRITAKNKANVDTTDYNYIIEDQICYNETFLTTLIYFPGSNGQPGETGVVISTVYDPIDCTPVGLFEPLAPSAFNPSAATPQIDVAIVDTGFDKNNPRIANATWTNPETNDTENCHTNDLNGYDFYNDIGNVVDTDGHGTAVAGAVTNGFNTNVNLDLMNLKFYQNERSSLFNGICAIYYAIDNGAKILNLSWGFVTTEDIPKMLKDALDYAKLKDVLVITSAGNRKLDLNTQNKFPANYNENNIITVGSHNQILGSNPSLSTFSNYGVLNVDLTAIGHVETVVLGNTVEIVSGTSISTPIVTRTAAEMRAKYPTLSSSDVRDCILNTVNVYPELGNYVATSGAINADAALACAHAKALSFCDELTVTYQSVHPQDTIMVSDYEIISEGIISEPLDVIYKATDHISLVEGFRVELGSTFTALIEDCNLAIPSP